jgi:hypothetical protein
MRWFGFVGEDDVGNWVFGGSDEKGFSWGVGVERRERGFREEAGGGGGERGRVWRERRGFGEGERLRCGHCLGEK